MLRAHEAALGNKTGRLREKVNLLGASFEAWSFRWIWKARHPPRQTTLDAGQVTVGTMESTPLIGSTNDHDNLYTLKYSGPDHVNMDDEFLAALGYKQELQRTYSTLEIFGISFSIMGLLPSIASTLSMGLKGGPVAIVWGWFISGFFLIAIGLGMSELASSLPTSGGSYYWAFHFASHSVKVPLSFFIGITNSMALIGGLCSITYGLSGQILALVQLVNNQVIITDVLTFEVFVVCILLQTVLTCVSSTATARLQAISIYINCFLILLFIIALPWGTSQTEKSFNAPSYVFTHFENASDWPAWWSFLQFGLMPAVWTIGSFDSCVHMSEEAKDPSRAVPIGILGSISICWVLGLVINIVICLCMTTDLDKLLNSPTSEPLAQIILDSLGTRWAILFMALISIGQFLMGSSVLVAISRQIWAFARDDGVPFADYIKVIHETLSTPIRATVISSAVAILIGCISLIGTTAASALFSLSVMGNYISWLVPQLLRFLSTGADFVPGKFYLGTFWSPLINWGSIAFQVLIIVMCCFPDDMHVTKETMNYTIVVNGAAWLVSMAYYYQFKRHSYLGPKCNLEDLMEVEVLEGLECEPVEIHGPAPPVKSAD